MYSVSSLSAYSASNLRQFPLRVRVPPSPYPRATSGILGCLRFVFGSPLPHIPAPGRRREYSAVYALCSGPPFPISPRPAPAKTKTRPQSKTTMAASNTPSVNGFASYFHLSIGGFKNFHTPRLRNTINGNLRYFSENCETGAPAN